MIYGLATSRRYYQRNTDVIGEVDQSMTGNTLLRVGVHTRGEGNGPSSWQQTGHIVLCPGERRALIAELQAQEAREPVITPEED